jgi:nucleoside-diphosphate-sugar epimerase
MDKKYVLITGATGFIGSRVAEQLLAEQYSLVAIVRKQNDYKNVEDLERKGTILVEGNFYDEELVEMIFRDFSIKSVIHIAALRGVGAGTKEDYYRTNVLGTEVLLQSSLHHGVNRFVFMSSAGVTGTIPGDLPGDTSGKFCGDNLYHKSKVLAEQKVCQYVEKGLDAYILRPVITYGAGDDGFPKTLVKLVKKRMLLLPTRDIKIHLLDVNTLADLVVKTLRHNGLRQRVFIAADDDPISLGTLANKIYHHYYQKEYPALLKLPETFFRVLLFYFKLIHSEKWQTRLLLISNNWYYDIGPTVSHLFFKPADTGESFVKSMCN